MLFRLCFYSAAIVWPLLYVGCLVGALYASKEPFSVPLASASLGGLLLFFFIGRAAAFLLGRTGLSCPFCGHHGHVGGWHNPGLWIECPTCGIVRGEGPLGLKIVREKLAD
jgi:hypothetical protein